MIEKYSDHAANERTFLAWIRTGIAVIAFGFVVEKFNIFVRSLAEAGASISGSQLQLKHLSGGFSHYDGLVWIGIGVAIIIVSIVRFVRTARMIDDEATHSAGGARAEVVLAITLAVAIAVTAIYLAMA